MVSYSKASSILSVAFSIGANGASAHKLPKDFEIEKFPAKLKKLRMGSSATGRQDSSKAMKESANAKSFKSSEEGDVGNDQGNFSTLYTMTNLPDNDILIYSRDEESGELTYEGKESTTGAGSGPFGSNNDFFILNSTGAITVAGACLLAVNAGSDDVSTFRIISKSRLEFSGKVSSGGTIPVSIAAREGLVYVLNAGANGSIQGFNMNPGTCELSPIGSSIELDQKVGPQSEVLPLFTSSAPAQVGFHPNGNLVALIKLDGGGQNFPTGEGSLNVYTINPDGTTSADTLEHIPISGAGALPFAFEFIGQGRMLLVDALGDSGAGGQVRLFDEELTELQSVSTTQSASCWIRYNPSNSCVYTANTGPNSISSFKLGKYGLELVEAAVPNFGAQDFELSPDGRYLYVQSCDRFEDKPSLYVYEMLINCGLVQVQNFTAPVVDGPIGCIQGLAMHTGGASAVGSDVTSVF